MDTVLAELGASDIPRVTVWNKSDVSIASGVNPESLAEEASAAGAVATSAADGFGIDSLVHALQDTLVRVALVRVEIDVPHDSGGVIGEVRKAGVVESEACWAGRREGRRARSAADGSKAGAPGGDGFVPESRRS